MLAELGHLAADVDRHPRVVATRASEILCQSRRDDHVTAAVAATLLARSRRDVREIEAAARAIDEAIALATPLGGDVLADAHMVAASIATYRDGPSVAADHLAQAWQHGSAALRPKIRIEQAITAKRLGRLNEALERYDEAIDVLRSCDEPIVLARVLSNRGGIEALLGEFDAAVADYHEAMELFASRGQEFAVAIVTQNLAGVVAATGDVPAALALFDDADNRLEQLGQPMLEAWIDRARALLSVGLLDDADELLGGAIDALAADGDRSGTAEAMLVRAEVARLAGDTTGAAVLAERAAEKFASIGSVGFEAAAELERLRASVARHRPDRDALGAAVRLAARLERDGARRPAIEALALASALALTCGLLEQAGELARRCEDAAKGVNFVEHRLAVTHATAAVLAAGGDHCGAIRRIDAALAEFDCYRATIGTPDGRRGSALHSAELAKLGARLVGEHATAVGTLAWSEARRRTLRRPGPGRPAGETNSASTSQMLELRSVIDELRLVETGESPSGRSECELVERRRQLERTIRHELVGRGAGAPPAARDHASAFPSVHDVVVDPLFAQWSGVSLDRHGNQLVAIVVHAGRARRVGLGDADELSRLASSVRSRLSALARAGNQVAPTLRDRLDRALDALDDMVRRWELAPGPVVLAMPDDLLAVPWCATATLRDRDVTLSASLSRWLASRRAAPTPPAATARVVAVAGARLAHAHDEVTAVLSRHSSPRSGARTTSRPMAGTPATGPIDPSRLLLDADIVHVAAHTRLRHDNPMWSTIELPDGPLFAHALTEAGSPRARLVVLSTCHSAVATGPSGAPLASLAGMLVEAGVENVVAAVGVLPDSQVTVDVMAFVHGLIARGVPVAAALRRARAAFPDEPAALSLACWGRG